MQSLYVVQARLEKVELVSGELHRLYHADASSRRRRWRAR